MGNDSEVIRLGDNFFLEYYSFETGSYEIYLMNEDQVQEYIDMQNEHFQEETQLKNRILMEHKN